MAWLAPKLRNRIQILEPTQTPNAAGGFTQGYNLLAEIWAAVKPVKAEYWRNVQIGELPTHNFIVRANTLAAIQSPAFSNAFAVGVPQIAGGLGRGMNIAFSNAFHTEEDLNPVKGSFFIKLLFSNSRERLFRISNVVNNNERGEYYRIDAMEVLETSG